jgi:hypothetical protein
VLGLVPEREKTLADESAQQESREALRQRWADAAKDVEQWSDAQTAKVQAIADQDTSSTLEEQVAYVKTLQTEIDTYHTETFPQLESLSKDMEEAIILDNPYTILTMDILRNKYYKLSQEMVSMISSIENQVCSARRRGGIHTNVIPEPTPAISLS